MQRRSDIGLYPFIVLTGFPGLCRGRTNAVLQVCGITEFPKMLLYSVSRRFLKPELDFFIIG